MNGQNDVGNQCLCLWAPNVCVKFRPGSIPVSVRHALTRTNDVVAPAMVDDGLIIADFGTYSESPYVQSTTSGGKGKRQQSEIEANANLDTARHEILRSYLSLSERIQLWCFYGFGSLLFWGLSIWLCVTALSTFFSFLIPDITLSPFGWVIAFCGSGAAVYHLLIGHIFWHDWKAANKTYDMSKVMIQALIGAPETRSHNST